MLGVYQSSNDYSLSMVRLRLINIKDWQIDKDMKFDCGAVSTVRSDKRRLPAPDRRMRVA
ncbi:hypothetical protein SCB29_20925 [Paraburkholderia sp. SIMBA_055]